MMCEKRGKRRRGSLLNKQKAEPALGVEPRIFSLQVRCVTTAPYGLLPYRLVNKHYKDNMFLAG